MRRSLSSRVEGSSSHIENVTRSLHGLAYKSAKERALTLLKKRLYVGSALFVLLACVLIFISPKTTAETSLFYPTSCLGGWKNPNLASDKPETEFDHDKYTADNSAVLDANTSADVFCGGFKGDIPEHTSPSAVVIRLYMSYDGEQATTTITGTNFASSTGSILDANASSAPSFQLDQSASSSSASSTTEDVAPVSPTSSPDVSTPPSNTEDTSSPAPSDATPSNTTDQTPPVSFFSHFITPVYAVESDEVATDTSSSTENASTTVSASSPDATTTDTEASSSVTQLFEILYTMDGKNWQSLGVVNKNEIEGTQFSIPLEASSTWVDISNMQVEVRRLATFDDIPPVYLDGMELEVTYAQQQEVQEDLSGDPKRYDVALATSTGDISTSVGKHEDGVHLLVGTPSGGQLFIYNNAEGEIKYSMGVGSDPVEVSSYQLDPGEYTAVMTDRENGCAGITLSECLHDPKTKGSSSFTIIPTRQTPAKYLPTSLGGEVPSQ